MITFSFLSPPLSLLALMVLFLALLTGFLFCSFGLASLARYHFCISNCFHSLASLFCYPGFYGVRLCLRCLLCRGKAWQGHAGAGVGTRARECPNQSIGLKSYLKYKHLLIHQLRIHHSAIYHQIPEKVNCWQKKAR